MKNPFRNPVFEKERRSRIRSHEFLAVIAAVNLILAAVAVVVLVTISGRFDLTGQRDYSSMLQIYLAVSMTICALMVLVLPAYAGVSVSLERERGSLESLLAAGIRPWQIAAGKAAACMDVMLILLISTLPVFSLCFAYGGVSLKDLFGSVLSLCLCGFVVTGVSVFASSLCRRSSAAILAAYGLTILLLGGTMAISILPGMVKNSAYQDLPGRQIAFYHYGLLLNPLVSYYGVLNAQAGSKSAVFDLINLYGRYRQNRITTNWTMISSVLQISLSLLALSASTLFIRRTGLRKN